MIVLALATGCNSSEPAAPAVAPRPAAAPPKARLAQPTGDVTIKRAAGDEWIAAADQMELFENDKVRTSTGASARLTFANGSLLVLGEDALIGIAETRPRPGVDRADVTVLKGRVDAELDSPEKQSLTVTTPSTTVRAGREIVFQ